MTGGGIDNQKVLGNCSSCNGLMQIPVVTDVAAFVICPHCQGKISVRTLIATIAPDAELVSDETQRKQDEIDYAADRQRVYEEPETPKPREKFVVPNQLSAGASRRTRKRRERQLRAAREAKLSNGDANKNANSKRGSSSNRRSSRDSSQPSSVPPTNAQAASEQIDSSRQPAEQADAGHRPAESNLAVAQSNTSKNSSAAPIESTPRPPSREANASRSSSRSSSTSRRRSDDDDSDFALSDVVKLLIGGVVAAPIAYVALLWIVGVDPFGMAPRFESLSPSLVPASLRSDEDESVETPPSPTAPVGRTLSFEDDGEGGLPMPKTNPDSIR